MQMLEASVWQWGEPEFRSQSSCLICVVGFRKQLEQRSIRCNGPGNEMMPKCPMSMNLLISVCQTLLVHPYSPVDY